MSINQRLAIAIPTYNRSEFLDYSLEVHIPIMQAHNIPIYISDNASTDNTKEVVKKWKKSYELIFYHASTENVGPDKNIEIALNLPESGHVWIMGDSNCFDQRSLELVVESLNSTWDVLIVNDNYRVSKGKKVYSEHNDLLSELGWHITQLSSLVISRKIILSTNFDLYFDSRFTHVGAVLGCLADCSSFNVLWLGDATIKPIMIDGIQKSSWKNITFEVWLKGWPQFVFSLPSIYSLDSKLKAISDHNTKTSIFSFNNLLKLRFHGYYNLNTLKFYRRYFGLSFGCKNIFIFYISLLVPLFVLRFIFEIKRIAKL